MKISVRGRGEPATSDDSAVFALTEEEATMSRGNEVARVTRRPSAIDPLAESGAANVFEAVRQAPVVTRVGVPRENPGSHTCSYSAMVPEGQYWDEQDARRLSGKVHGIALHGDANPSAHQVSLSRSVNQPTHAVVRIQAKADTR